MGETEINVRDCPECEDGTKGSYEGRVLVGGRGTYTCPACGTRWQNADERPSTCGVVALRAKPGSKRVPGEGAHGWPGVADAS